MLVIKNSTGFGHWNTSTTILGFAIFSFQDCAKFKRLENIVWCKCDFLQQCVMSLNSKTRRRYLQSDCRSIWKTRGSWPYLHLRWCMKLRNHRQRPDMTVTTRGFVLTPHIPPTTNTLSSLLVLKDVNVPTHRSKAPTKRDEIWVVLQVEQIHLLNWSLTGGETPRLRQNL